MHRRLAALLFRSVMLIILTHGSVLGRAGAAPADDPTRPDGPSVPMVLIRPGAFQMGSHHTEPQSRIDETRHRVVLKRPFRLATTEVTQALWSEIMGSNPGYFGDCPDCPVENVSWYEAVEFCNALSVHHGLTPVYRITDTDPLWLPCADGYRLPTEAEWEYACRAGTLTPYSTGRCLPSEQANFNAYDPLAGCPDGMNRGETVEVGSFPANAWGLHDMHGNVLEWCWDWYGPRGPASVEDPRGPHAGDVKVIRGGSWYCPGNHCRSAFRAHVHPSTKIDHLGFRLARSVVTDEDRP
jgi:formylglycine-generating enzyme